MNNKVKAGLKTLAVFGIAGMSSLIAMLIVIYIPPIYIVFGLLTVAIIVMANTVYNYFLSMSEASDKINSLMEKLEK